MKDVMIKELFSNDYDIDISEMFNKFFKKYSSKIAETAVTGYSKF